MAENVFVVKFTVESEAYQAFAELKAAALTNDYVISQAFLVKNESGKLVEKDEFDTGIESANDMGAGALIGALVGVIGGPVGVLLGASYGLLVGSTVDAMDIADSSLLINQVSSSVAEGETALLLLVSETHEGSFTRDMGKFSTTVTKFDAAEVAEEVEKAVELEHQMRKEAHKQMKEDKKAERKEKIEAHRAKIKADFENLKKNGLDTTIDPMILD